MRAVAQQGDAEEGLEEGKHEFFPKAPGASIHEGPAAPREWITARLRSGILARLKGSFMHAQFIDSPERLASLCERLRGHPWLAIDTEFIREKSYYPQLCLIQVATTEVVACIDPLALPDLDPFLDLVFDPGVTKILHAARQDLEILLHLRGELPRPIFDTQIAATVLGYGDQIGYGNLVKEGLDIDLEKGYARTDWFQRPLDPDQILYAADDVRHLGALYETLLEQLTARGRLEWLAEDFAALTDPRCYVTPPEEAWLRIKGVGKLKGVQLAVARALAAWREREAIAQDKPRRWLLKDELLLDLARLMPENRSRLERLRGLEKGSLDRYGAHWVSLIAAARKEPRDQWPLLEQGERLTPRQEAVLDLMGAVLQQTAAEHGISPSAIAGRRHLEQLLLGNGDTPLTRGWRGALVGETLLSLLEGRLHISVSNGGVTINKMT